jgi:transcriptional regulator
MRRDPHSKTDRALELFEKGLSSDQIAARLGTTSRSIASMLRTARAKRERAKEERDADQLARAMLRLCDEMGPNI